MMIPVTGENLKVSGKSIHIAPTGPNPGSTPVNVPKRAPKKQNSKLMGSKTIENPNNKLEIISI
jgi:hypothetical protein